MEKAEWSDKVKHCDNIEFNYVNQKINPNKMATEGSHQLSEKNIVQLAAAIAAKDMKTIAEGYLDITPETVKNKLYETLGDAEAFNRDIIRYWANKNSGSEQVKVLFFYLQDIVLFEHFNIILIEQPEKKSYLNSKIYFSRKIQCFPFWWQLLRI